MEINFSRLEEKILRFWEKNEIFERSIKKRAGARDFVFYEGPPTANAKPGIHHALSRVFKDIICRYRTMRGFRVLRKAGWDTHGLPVELEIEKKLGLKSKKDIEKYGISKFNKKCKESVWRYKKDWERLTERIGYWLDLKNPYVTYEPDYIESVWWILKEIYKKGLLYRDYKVVPYCPRCGTSLSSHEVALGYQKIKEPAIYIKFKILNPELKNCSLLVWTTTPWTLPGNVAIALNPKFTYGEVKIGDEYLIFAKERLSVLGRDYELVREFRGKDLMNLRYEGLYPLDEEISKIAYKVIPADFVSLKEGTGLVHIAPAFGEEDMELIKNQNEEFPILLTVDEEGRFKLEVKKWAGMFVKKADPLIIEDLKNRGLLFKEELYEHDYPFCWRCDTPLLYYAKKGWFIRMTKVKRDLLKNNQKIKWVPAHLKEGRFGEWLKEVKDWALSRERYWGTPLPIWQCKNCHQIELIGSKRDLLRQKFTTNKYYILRHGESLCQTKYKNLVIGWKSSLKNYRLTEKGGKTIEKIAEILKKEKINLIYSSDFLRTAETAQIVAKKIGAKIIYDKRIRDIYWGIYDGKKKEEFYRDFPTPAERFEKAPPKGENWTTCKKRILSFIKNIDQKYRNKNILIVGHRDPLWLLEGAMKGLSNEKLLKQRIGGKAIEVGEMRKLDFKILPYNQKGELDLHRPYIDEVKFLCPKCGGSMERVPEVIDCWFDAGDMPFAQSHWPFENQKSKIKNRVSIYGNEGEEESKILFAHQKSKPPKLFPADYICEGIDQTRGWFYTLLAISTLLGFGTPYKNVISVGHVLDEKGEKMSKSKGNVVDPWYIVEKYGADATRWYFFTINQPGEPKLFSERDILGALRKFILTFWNCFVFFSTYSPITHFRQSSKSHFQSKNILDRWVISKLNELILDVKNYLDKYDATGAARTIENFVIDDLSLWYIRRSRERFQKPKTEKKLKEASQTLNYLLLAVSKLTAPFIPFLSEEIYQKVRSSKLEARSSIHLENWPNVNKKLIDKKLEKKMAKVREIVAIVLAERARAGIKVRQPLKELRMTNYELRRDSELLDLIKEEVNVKEITFGKSLKLDTKITPELKEEGILREIIRNLQEMRKIAGFTPKDTISIQFEGEKKLNDILLKNQEKILMGTWARDLKFGKKEKFETERKIKIKEQNLWLAIKKVGK